MSTPIVASKSLRRTLLAPTSVAVMAAKSVTSITRVGTTATAACTAHGYSTGDWVLIAGATHPLYDTVFQITVSDANTFTFTFESDPGADAAGTLTAQKGVAAAVWGDGSIGLNPAALPSACQATLSVRFVNGTAGPGAAAPGACWVGTSATGTPGTFRPRAAVSNPSAAALADSGMIDVDVSVHRFALAFLYNVTTNAVTAEVTGNELTFSAG